MNSFSLLVTKQKPIRKNESLMSLGKLINESWISCPGSAGVELKFEAGPAFPTVKVLYL
mgnify:CR=1 FL=1